MWSDIWPNLNEDLLSEMTRLNRSYGRRYVVWHRCWGQDLIRQHVRQYGW